MRYRSFPHFILLLGALLSLASGVFAADQKRGEVAFKTHCAACHLLDEQVVGPSLVEMRVLYQDKTADFIAWSKAPVRKREGLIEMPSMAHVGEESLLDIHAYILATTEGVREKKKPRAKKDPFPDDGRRPKVMRIFVDEASPAAIVVAMPGDLSYCYDAASSRLRYVWSGGFIDGFPYWKGNGSSLAKIAGDIVYRESERPYHLNEAKADPQFLGYRIDPTDQLPVFRYAIGDQLIEEKITSLPEGEGIQRELVFKNDNDALSSISLVPSATSSSLKKVASGSVIIETAW